MPAEVCEDHLTPERRGAARSGARGTRGGSVEQPKQPRPFVDFSKTGGRRSATAPLLPLVRRLAGAGITPIAEILRTGAVRRRRGLTRFAQNSQEVVAVAFEFGLAHAVELQEGGGVAGAAFDHLQEGGVVEDDVRGYVVGGGELLAAGA